MQLLNICPTCGEPRTTQRQDLVIERPCACDRAKKEPEFGGYASASQQKRVTAQKAAHASRKHAKPTKAKSYATAKRSRRRGRR